MKKYKDKLQEIIDYFEEPVGYSAREVRSDMLAEIEDLKGNSPDEIGLEWDGEHLMLLEEFAEKFYNKIIFGVCNILKSFKDEL